MYFFTVGNLLTNLQDHRINRYQGSGMRCTLNQRTKCDPIKKRQMMKSPELYSAEERTMSVSGKRRSSLLNQ